MTRARIGRRALLGVGPLAALGLAGCSVPSEMKVDADAVLSIALGQAESHPSYQALVDFGDDLAESTGGRVGARVYPNEALGASQEVLQLVTDGAVDMAVMSSTQLENLSSDFRPINLPGVFADIDHQARVLADEDVVGGVFSSLVDSHNLLVLGGVTQGSRHLYTSKGPIKSPDDMAGVKVRVQESAVFLALIRAMGGSPTPMAYGEVYTALQAGVLDGAENNEISYWTQRHYEIAKHFALTNHMVGLDYLIANADMVGKLGGDEPTFLEAAATMQSRFVETWKQETEKTRKKMTKAGVIITEEDLEGVWNPIYQKVAEDFLGSSVEKDLYEKIRALDPAQGGR